MNSRFSDFRWKEVINVSGGQRLGCVDDAEFDAVSGKVLSLIVPGPSKFFGFLGREDDYVLPWECIARIGDDIVLVDVQGELQRAKRPKRPAL